LARGGGARYDEIDQHCNAVQSCVVIVHSKQSTEKTRCKCLSDSLGFDLALFPLQLVLAAQSHAVREPTWCRSWVMHALAAPTQLVTRPRTCSSRVCSCMVVVLVGRRSRADVYVNNINSSPPHPTSCVV
jgi:hypothetical protein